MEAAESRARRRIQHVENRATARNYRVYDINAAGRVRWSPLISLPNGVCHIFCRVLMDSEKIRSDTEDSVF